MSYGQLATTGAGSLVIGGLVVDQMSLVAIAAGVVIAGAMALRVGFRRGKPVNAR